MRRRREPGKVWLVGAGPGAPELLTLKAARVLAEADVVLVDDLVDPGVLTLARAAARVIHVGKRGGCRSTPQAFIEELMLREARDGKVVVRLKGGDPCVFGRGGEELASLRAGGVDVELVPGITAGIAAPASIGIPVTHRDHAPGVALVTGHARDDGGKARAPDWRALAQSGLTLVIYMGVAHAGEIRERLLAAGMRTSMPVAVIADATRPRQRSIVSTLERFATAAAAAGLGSPAVIVVGDVVASAAGIQAFSGTNFSATPLLHQR
jgi:uroporphyrin-III C-methyltransferase